MGQIPGRRLLTYLNYVGFEAGAAFIRQFEPGSYPACLQTEGYAEAVSANSVNAVGVAAIVGLRLQCRSELTKRDPRPRQYYVLDEAVIRRPSVRHRPGHHAEPAP